MPIDPDEAIEKIYYYENELPRSKPRGIEARFLPFK